MNCLEFRREVLVDPHRPSREAEAHAANCATCSQFRAEALKLDDQIRAGLSVPVPDGFAERIARGATAGSIQPRRHFMAASLVLATAIGTGVYIVERDDPLARAGIDFVVDQEVNAILRSKPSDPSALHKVARALNVEIPPQVGEVRYVGICRFQGTIAHHVVIMTPDGKATLLLLPERSVGAKVRASARGLRSGSAGGKRRHGDHRRRFAPATHRAHGLPRLTSRAPPAARPTRKDALRGPVHSLRGEQNLP